MVGFKNAIAAEEDARLVKVLVICKGCFDPIGDDRPDQRETRPRLAMHSSASCRVTSARPSGSDIGSSNLRCHSLSAVRRSDLTGPDLNRPAGSPVVRGARYVHGGHLSVFRLSQLSQRVLGRFHPDRIGAVFELDMYPIGYC